MSVNSIKAILGAVIAIGFMLFLPVSAGATLLGQQITHSWFLGGTAPANLFRVNQYTVDANGAELICPNQTNSFCDGFTSPQGTQIFDVGESTISFIDSLNTDFFGSSFNGWVWSDLVWANGPGVITGVQLVTDIVGLDATRLGFTANTVSLNMQGLSTGRNAQGQITGQGGSFTLTLETAHTVQMAEPGALAMLGVGLTAFGLARFRKPSGQA